MIQLSKADLRRAMVRKHFAPRVDLKDAFRHLRSVQFDPIAPVGCNHDLVLQARVPGYKVGDWAPFAYEQREVYDGWDKQASLVPYDSWPLHRYYHEYHRSKFVPDIFDDQIEAVHFILKELEERGPMMPRDFEFQAHKAEWKGTWFGPSVTKNVLRALWHTGIIMTTGRKGGQHIYDLTERVVPADLYQAAPIPRDEMIRELFLERHQVLGILRPNAPYEIWNYQALMLDRQTVIPSLIETGDIVPVEVEKMKANATPAFLELLDQPSLEKRVVFVAPLDQFMWDRKLTAHVFNFDYSWEIYTPEHKRRWGYYVLPVLYGDELVARVEFFCRAGVLEMRQWHFEVKEPDQGFYDALGEALANFMSYCSAKKIKPERHIDKRIKELARSIRNSR